MELLTLDRGFNVLARYAQPDQLVSCVLAYQLSEMKDPRLLEIYYDSVDSIIGDGRVDLVNMVARRAESAPFHFQR